jgi:flagellar biogenesis protein FliO
MGKYGPDRSDYKDFEAQLADESSSDNVRSGLKIFLALLFVIPVVVVILFVLMRFLAG